MKIYNLCILIIVDSLLHANSFSLSFTREHVVRTPWKEVKRVLGKFQESSIPPLDHPSSHDLTPRALSHSPLTSFPLVPEVQDPNEKGASGARVKQRGRETAREWTSGRKRERERERESGVMHCEKIRYPVDSSGVFLLFPSSIFLSSSFSSVSFQFKSNADLLPSSREVTQSDGTEDIASDEKSNKRDLYYGGKARMLSLLRKYAPFIALFFELIGDRWTWSITGIGQVCLDI